MSDSDTPAGGETGAPAEADQAQSPADEQPILAINAQYIKDLSFENPNAPRSLIGMDQGPDIEVDVNVQARNLAPSTFEVVLHIRAEAKTPDMTIFIAELSYGGACIVGSQVPEEHVRPLVLVEAPRQLFPFARAIIANAARDAGFPPLLINPIDFAELFRNSQNNAEAASQDS